MARKVLVNLVLGLALALGATALVASNMGFKLTYALNQVQAGVSNSGTNTIALPDNRKAGLNHCRDLMNDIGFINVTTIQRFLEPSDGIETYTGRKSGGIAVPFQLTAGEGYFLRMATTKNYVIVGSHNPGFVHVLDQAQAGVSNTGTNFFAYPYHSLATNAKELMDDIGFASVANVQRFIEATDSLEVYTGRKTGGLPVPFPLTPGEAYFIRMNTTVNYIPAHY